MKTREKDKEILGRDRDDLGRLIAKGLIDGDDVIQSYMGCGEFDRAQAMRDALIVQAAMTNMRKIVDKYSHDGGKSNEARRRFSLFNRAYASISRTDHTDGIDYVGTDMCRVGESYVRAMHRK